MKTISKKTLAIVLSVILVVVALPISVGAEGTFDFKDASNWQIVPFAGSESHTSAPALATDVSYNSSGSSILVKRINGTGYGVEFPVEANTDYTLTFRARHAGTGNTRLLGAWVVTNLADASAEATPANTLATFNVTSQNIQNTWLGYTASFNAGSSTTAGFVVKVPDGAWGDTYLDGFVLSKTADLSFEDPDTWVYTAQNQWYDSSYDAKAETTVVADGSAASVKLCGAGVVWTKDFAVEKNSAYTLSFKYRTPSTKAPFSKCAIFDSTAGKINFANGLALGTMSGELVSQSGFAAGADAWRTYSIEFSAGNRTHLTLALAAADLGWSNIFLDDFTLVKGATADSYFEDAGNWRWETVQGSYTSASAKLNTTATDFIAEGTTSVRLIGACGTANVIDFPVEANTDYSLSFQYKADSSNGIKNTFREVGIAKDFATANPETTNWNMTGEFLTLKSSDVTPAYNFPKANVGVWNTETFTFNSGDNTSVALIINHNDLGWNHIYLDDFKLTALVPTVGSEKTQNFETYTNDNVKAEADGNKYYDLTAATSLSLKAAEASDWTADSAEALVGRHFEISFDMASDKWNVLGDSEAWNFLWTEFKFASGIKGGNLLANGHFSSDFNSFAKNRKITLLSGNWQRYTFTVDCGTVTNFNGISFGRLAGHAGQQLDVDNFNVKVLSDTDAITKDMFYTEAKASIRSVDAAVSSSQGFRVKTSIYKPLIESRNIVEYGTIAIRTARMTDTALTIGTANAAKGIAYDAAAGKDVIYEENDTHKIFTGVLINIPERFYGSDYTVRSYAKDADGNYYYGDQFTLCVYKVVKAILDSSEPDAGTPEHAQWVSDCATAQSIIDQNEAQYNEWLNR